MLAQTPRLRLSHANVALAAAPLCPQRRSRNGIAGPRHTPAPSLAPARRLGARGAAAMHRAAMLRALLLLALLPRESQVCGSRTHAHRAPPLTRVRALKGTFRRVFAWGLDRYGQMGAGGRATAVGVAAQAFNCMPVQVPGLNWAALTQLGACDVCLRAARCASAAVAAPRQAAVAKPLPSLAPPPPPAGAPHPRQLLQQRARKRAPR